MIENILKYKKCIPNEYKRTVYDIDFLALYNLGKRVIFFDIDNTLISYKEKHITSEATALIKKVQDMGFEVLLVSNNKPKRVKIIMNDTNLNGQAYSLKPLKSAFRRARRKLSKKYSWDQIIEVGDQLLTDVYGSRGLNVYTILVKPIDHKTEVWTTRFNRKIEKKMIKKIAKKDPKSYNDIILQYERDKNEQNNL